MKHAEDNLQIAVVTWFKYQYPKHIIAHCPNGGYRNAREAARFKRMGVLSGFPDLIIPVTRKEYAGLFIELKAGKNKPTANQLTVMQKLQNEGYKCEVCYSVDEFINVVNEYLK